MAFAATYTGARWRDGLPPGVYEDVPRVVLPRDVRMDVAAFIGLTERGPVATPVAVESWDEFRRHFGNAGGGRLLPQSVFLFFANGGQRCVVVRALNYDYVMTSPIWSKEMMPDTFDRQVAEFIEALKKALPEASDEHIHWCYQYVSGALALTLAQTGRIDRLSGGSCVSTDFDAAYEHMIPFIAAGFRAVCGQQET